MPQYKMLYPHCAAHDFMRIFCCNQQATEHIAAELAEACPVASVVYLHGALGAGKSSFARAFLQALGVQGAIKSPTYSLLEAYEVDALHALHLDLYRIIDADEVAYLALEDYAEQALVYLIEWPEKGVPSIPLADLEIFFSHLEAGRMLEFRSHTAHAENWIAKVLAAHTEQIKPIPSP